MKILFAFVFFLASISAATWYLSSQLKDLSQIFESRTGGRRIPEPLFYQTVGNVPDRPLASPALMPPKTQFTLELALCEDKACVNQVLDQLEAQGIEAFYTPLNRHGKVIYRVRQGVYATQEAAVSARTALSQKDVASSVVEL